MPGAVGNPVLAREEGEDGGHEGEGRVVPPGLEFVVRLPEHVDELREFFSEPG